MNPLDLLRGLGRATGGGTALDPMLQTSNFIATKLRNAGLIPGIGIKKEYGGALNAIDTGKYGPTDWNPNANPLSAPPAPVLPPPTQGAADRAYQRELSRTAQLTAQDPELQRYEKARAGAKSQEEMNAARDIGMEMWAKANPTLAAKVQPGQSGFDAIYKQTGQMPTPTFNPLMERTFPGMSRGADEYTMGPSPLVPQVDPALNPAGPTYVLGEGPRLMNFSNEDVTPEMIKAYQEQLLKQAGAK